MRFLGHGIIFTIVMCSAAFGHTEEKALTFATQEVAPKLYMLSGVGGFTGGNIALSIGDDGVVMIDDSMPPLLDVLKKAIAGVTPKPVDFLINTHIHGDHTGNNASIGASGTRIVAHQNLRQRMLEKGVSGEKVPASALPVITFSDEMTFHLNGHEAHLVHVAHAHTDGDAMIHFVQDNVIHAGDVVFRGLFPYIDLDSGGSVDGYIAAQQRLLAMSDENTKIIPGHGPLSTKKDIEKDHAMLQDSRDIVALLIKKKKTEAEVVALNPLKKYHDTYNWGFISTEKMTRQLYRSLVSADEHAKHAVEKKHSAHSDHSH